MNRKYTDQQKVDFQAFRKAGKSIAEASKLAKVDVATGMKWNVKMKRPPPAPKKDPPVKVSSNLLVFEEITVPRGSRGVADGAGAGGADGARTAKVDGEEVPLEEVPEETEEETDGEKKEEPPPKQKPRLDPARILIDLCKLGTYLVVRGYVLRAKLPMDDDFRAIARFTKEEEAELMEYAPATAAMMGGLLMSIGPYVAPGFFFFGLIMMLGDRVDFVKKCKAAKEKNAPRPKSPAEPPPQGSKEAQEAKETETIEDPLPNGFRPSTATDDLGELMKGSFYSKTAEQRWEEENRKK